MVIELPEEEKDDGALTERGSNIVSNLLALCGKEKDDNENIK